MSQPIRKRRCLGKLLVLIASTWALSCSFHETASAEPSVKFQHVEITQGIQDSENSVPMVAGKRTFLKYYVERDTNVTLKTIDGSLKISQPSTQPITITSIDKIVASDVSLGDSLGAKRVSEGSQLTFEIPIEWTIKGKIFAELSNLIADDGAKINCTGCSSPLPIIFAATPTLRILLVGLRYERGKSTFEPRDIDYQSVISWLRRAYPTGSIEVQRAIKDWLAPTPFDEGQAACSNANSFLDTIKQRDKRYLQFHYFGLVYDGGQSTNRMVGCAKSPSKPNSYASASGPAGSATAQDRATFFFDRSQSYAGRYAGHEIAHTLGLRHHESGCGDLGLDPSWPFPKARKQIGTSSKPYVGFDGGDSSLNIRRRLYPWATTGDIMTYCGEVWPSAYAYFALCVGLSGENGTNCSLKNSRFDFAIPKRGDVDNVAGPAAYRDHSSMLIQRSSFRRAAIVRSKTNSAEVLRVAGRINLKQNSGAILTVEHLKEDEIDAVGTSERSDITISAFDIAGHLLSRSGARFSKSSDSKGAVGIFSGYIFYHKGIDRIELARNGAVLDHRTASVQKDVLAVEKLSNPRPKALEGNFSSKENRLIYSWISQNPSAVSFDVQISTDGGKYWETVALERRKPNLIIDKSWLTGRDLIFRVTESDGIHETMATSRSIPISEIKELMPH
jgi:hypothetical protein